MSVKNDSASTPPRMAPQANHNLSWIAMVAMAAMCLAVLVYAASINLD
ncbi:hypothetical protein [Magnetospirillum aberrantis]|uniref:Uncharacterized protein n=1 Tax=Magnetospirillum aberrantis SpK TaxID=908842 RepID=A0A7C9V1S8_9PROT|nr:hypothetical protein [Magnetospirillum aberrantis]NFV82274.1 hypothetical protein [Magnetospirillum aberrantis SpK]